MFTSVRTLLQNQGLAESTVNVVAPLLVLAIVLLVAYVTLVLARQLVVPAIEKILLKTQAQWDDTFVRRGFFVQLSRLVPIVIVYMAADLLFASQPFFMEFIKRGSMVLLVVVGTTCLNTLLLVTGDIYETREVAKERPVAGYLSIIRIALYVFAGVFVVATLTGKSPWGILSVLGGLTAVLILVFKDTILGFVASLQISSNKMLRVGDWLEMPRYNADGDVIDVSIHTVKVQNWDKTITTIPTYALVSNSFKNWRGMSESGGRRIKRALFIDMNSIRFCDDEMLERFAEFSLIKDYLRDKSLEIEEHNKQLGVDGSKAINGRQQTNIGVFRAYVKAYLRSHPKIHQDMTFLVRHLAPTSKGLPMEIYVFSNDQVWSNYEAIQADIFDHILAVLPEFDLQVFQEPSGVDFRALQHSC